MTRILIINGSPRKKGNSDYIAQFLVNKFPNIDFIEWKLRESSIDHCNGCEVCYKGVEFTCSKKDDFSEKAVWMSEFNYFLIITPVYQGGVTSIVKQWMDRCEIFRNGNKLQNKLCGGIAIGGFAGGGQELTLMQIQYFAHISAMKYVASLGNIRSHLGGHCIAFLKQEVKKDKEGLMSCENVVKQMLHY